MVEETVVVNPDVTESSVPEEAVVGESVVTGAELVVGASVVTVAELVVGESVVTVADVNVDTGAVEVAGTTTAVAMTAEAAASS